MKSKINAQLIGFITTFENVTGAHAKDAFFDHNGRLVYVIKQGDAGKAIGKKGSAIARVSRLIKKKIKIIEYHDDVKEFVKNAIDPLIVDRCDLNGRTLTLTARSKTTKASLIGRDKANIKHLNMVVKRYFPIDVVVA